MLDAIARALRLDDAERSHLFDLARAADGTSQLLRPRRRSRKQWTPRPSLTWVLDSITGGAAIVRNGRMDLLATDQLGRAMHASLYERSPGPVPNFARYTFLDEDSHRFYSRDWDTAADTAVAILRTEAGRDPHDPLMHELVGELATRSEENSTPVGQPRRPAPRRGDQDLPPRRRGRPPNSPTKVWTWSPTPVSPSRSTPPNRRPGPRKPSHSSDRSQHLTCIDYPTSKTLDPTFVDGQRPQKQSEHALPATV